MGQSPSVASNKDRIMRELNQHRHVDGPYEQHGLLYSSICFYAIEEGHFDILEFAIMRGVNLSTQDAHGDTALTRASEKGFTRLVKLLLDNKAHVNHMNHRDDSALMLAARENHPSVVRLLLKDQADPQLPTDCSLARSIVQMVQQAKS